MIPISVSRKSQLHGTTPEDFIRMISKESNEYKGKTSTDIKYVETERCVSLDEYLSHDVFRRGEIPRS